MPLTIVAGLSLLGRVNPEQAYELGSEPHRFAVDDLKPWL
jgi:hypothetical protein